MKSEILARWQRAERDACEAAFQLREALRVPGHVPGDEMFESWRIRRATADLALRELVAWFDREMRLVRDRRTPLS
jgi:hypothetical protein